MITVNFRVKGIIISVNEKMTDPPKMVRFESIRSTLNFFLTQIDVLHLDSDLNVNDKIKLVSTSTSII